MSLSPVDPAPLGSIPPDPDDLSPSGSAGDRPRGRARPTDVGAHVEAVTWRKWRIPGARDAVTLLVLGGCLVLLGAWWWWSGRPQQVTVVPAAAASPGPSRPAGVPPVVPNASAPPPPDGVVLIDVRGAVRRRGVLELPTGARVIDAIEAAGGLRRGAGFGSLNLAEVLRDGQQIRVGDAPDDSAKPASATDVSGGAGGAAGGGATDSVDLNRAEAGDLEVLSGVGPVLAERIIAHREQFGPFASVDELIDVPGIGASTLEGIRADAVAR